MDPNNYLDLWGILVNDIIGGTMLFMVIALCILFYIAVRYQIPYQVTIILGALLILVGMVANSAAFYVLYILLLLFIGVLAWALIEKFIKRS